jgi:circadian clock protein KaiC
MNLSDLVLNQDLDAVLAEIIKQVTAIGPSIVVVDSFRTVLRKVQSINDMELRSFVQQLTQFLTSWEATTFLVGEFGEEETHGDPLFTITDGLFWLSQHVERNSVVRKLQIMKVRGQDSVPGLHTIRITGDGVQAFSRTLGFTVRNTKPSRGRRLSMGVSELDAMMGGGVLEGDSLLIAGPSGTGKTALATQFIAAGLRNGEPAIMAIFEERPKGYTRAPTVLGWI